MAAFVALGALAVASPGPKGGLHAGLKAYVEDSLLASVQQNPKQSFDVIVQGEPGGKAVGLLDKLFSDKDGDSVGKADVRQQFT